MILLRKYLGAVIFLLIPCVNVYAQIFSEKNITVLAPQARPQQDRHLPGVVYLTIKNAGNVADVLRSVSTPVADAAEIHRMDVDAAGVMRMRSVTEFVLPAHSQEVFQPGSYHVMLLGLKKKLEPGTEFPMTMDFQKAGRIKVQVKVQPHSGG